MARAPQVAPAHALHQPSAAPSPLGTSAQPAGLFTVPPGVPFLDALAAAILDGELPRAGGGPLDPLALPAMTVYLPTKRATRAFGRALLDHAGTSAILLPRIVPIGSAGDEAGLLLGEAAPSPDAAAFDLPEPVSEIERAFILMQLVQRWLQQVHDIAPGESAWIGEASPAQALKLARELARLIDMIETEGVALDRLQSLVPEEHAAHWQRTLEFLKVVTQAWPGYLQAVGKISSVHHRNLLISAEARKLFAGAGDGPVIAAGITGSIPATAELMRIIAGREDGAIVLPGLDTELDEESAAAILQDHREHPQYGLLRLLQTLGAERGRVGVIGRQGSRVPRGPRAVHGDAAARPFDPPSARARLIATAMLPAAITDRWSRLDIDHERQIARAGLEGMCLIEAPTAQDEAEVVALILREAAERPGVTAALVSPDRVLARRVAIRLQSFGIGIDDSAGRPLRKTLPGALLDTVLAALAEDLAPAPLMALLKHPLTRLGRSPFAMRRAARALEIAAFRTPYLGRGIAGIEAALVQARRGLEEGTRRERAVARLWEEDWRQAHDLVAALAAALEPLTALIDGEPRPFGRWVRAHAEVAMALSMPPPETADERDGGRDAGGDADAGRAAPDRKPHPLWWGEAGETAGRLFASLMDEALPHPLVMFADYPAVYRQFAASETVRPRVPVHPRLSIWGPFEARLQQPDILVLGSLNEGTWPETTDPGPWLNRPMRASLELPQPEERIGHAAHDFTTLVGAPQVYLTRAEKVGGVPQVPSRWLLRLKAVLGGMGLTQGLAPSEPWLGWARSRDRAAPRPPARRPMPCPALNLRPRRLSVSDVERWIANPYALYAGRILGLEPLPALGALPDSALRGTIIHRALGGFAERFATALPDDIAAELIALARDQMGTALDHPRAAAFWLGRFERFAGWFAETEPARRPAGGRAMAEVAGAMVIAAPGGPFTLTARADRIDLLPEGILITDYKSGSGLDTLARNAAKGRAPQLPLEAAIARAGGFKGIGATSVRALRYISASGGEPPGAELTLAGDPTALADEALARLSRLIADYDQPETPYAAARRHGFDYRHDAFAHLSRLGEWSVEDSAEEGAPEDGFDSEPEQGASR